jgi:hypothetical protein
LTEPSLRVYSFSGKPVRPVRSTSHTDSILEAVMFPSRRTHARLPLLLLLIAATVLSTACDDTTTPVGETAEVTVMTRNLYLGADIFRIMDATGPEQIPAIVAEIFGIMVTNDFPARAGALAAEIQENDPHLIGLQEVTLYRIQDPHVPNSLATEIFVDFLAVLLDSLEARGLNYVVASQVENADVQMPAAKSPTEFFDVRMTDRDVILARAGVQTSAPGPGDAPYGLLTEHFTDAWTALGTGGPGLTCCHPEFLTESHELYSRIDLIVFRGDITVASARVVGDQPGDRTPGGLWPSDHAGVVATLRIPK